MGRHAAPELDSPTEVIPVVRPEEGHAPEDGAIDLVALVRNADRKSLRIAAAGLVAVAGAICMPGLINLVGHQSSSHLTVSSTVAARQQGQAYGEEMRDAGYNSMSVGVRCSIPQRDYSEADYAAFQDGCNAVYLGMLESGHS